MAIVMYRSELSISFTGMDISSYRGKGNSYTNAISELIIPNTKHWLLKRGVISKAFTYRWIFIANGYV